MTMTPAALPKPVVTRSNGVETTSTPIPTGWVEIDSYTPHSCPWDVHGLQHQREHLKVLEDVGIIGIPLVTHHRRISPQGTGPGGRIRFGDDMMPGRYHIIVPVSQEKAARAALEAHQAQIRLWLDNKADMPAACRY